MLKGTFWSTEPVSEYFDGMMTYRKARFMIGKKSTKLFSLFSFWVHACIPCNFHILPVALHMLQKVCQLMMKQQSIIGWTIRETHETESIWKTKQILLCLHRQTWNFGQLGQTTVLYSACFYLFFLNLACQRSCKED